VELSALHGVCFRERASGNLVGAGDEIATHASLLRERDMVAVVKRGLDRYDQLGNGRQFEPAPQLRDEQRRAVGMVLDSTDLAVNLRGAAGTGKTHTIHYLACQLPDHTTLLVTAEQVGLLDHYFQLARFLQPAMIVIEDVDLIARARETMYGPCDESILNKLLNEMDGLREDAVVLFILITNRPDSLEAALASRPGRIDQAIEFPLPDENGRRLLVRLYACGLPLDESVVETIVRRTDKASAAFIKELMRRAAQFYIQNGGDGRLQLADVNAALEEMLFTGGSLNAKLLGAADVTPTAVH
jgi:ATPase family associated with various cellular activities (AAA)